MRDDFNQVMDGSTIIRSRWTTWGYLLGRPAPWPARCERCRTDVGTFDDEDTMITAIFEHVQRCTWWRLRRWVRGPA